VDIYDVLDGIKDGRHVRVELPWTAGDMEEKLPAAMRRTIAQKKLKFYNIDAVKIAGKVGLGGRINMIMQTAFFKLAKVIPVDEAIDVPQGPDQEALRQKGRQDRKDELGRGGRHAGRLEAMDYPAAWAEATGETVRPTMPRVGQERDAPMIAQGRRAAGERVYPDGIFPVATTQYEKRGVAINVPEWIMDNCIQCNQCAMVCPTPRSARRW
jgi:pyruvate-ferredoxin/flavodoxin oxidoreductase